jgi:hypothetical protein
LALEASIPGGAAPVGNPISDARMNGGVLGEPPPPPPQLPRPSNMQPAANQASQGLKRDVMAGTNSECANIGNSDHATQACAQIASCQRRCHLDRRSIGRTQRMRAVA